MSPLKLALLSLSRRRVTTFLAILSIAISVACSGILLRLYLVSENRFSTFGLGGDAIIGAKAGGIEILLGSLNGEGEYPGFLPYKLFQSLKAEETVRFEDGTQSGSSSIRSIIPFVYFGKFENFRVVGTDDSFFNQPDPIEILRFAEGQWTTGLNEVVVGFQVARQKNLQIGDSLSVKAWAGETPSARQIQMRVTGILQETQTTWDRLLFSNIPTAHQTLAMLDLSQSSIWGSDVLHYFLVHLHPDGFPALESLINGRTVGQAVHVQEQTERLENLTGTGKKLGLFVTALVLFLGGLSVAAMLITRFEAMSLQLAVLRAIGYKKRAIGRWLIWEGLLLGLSACVVGLILDALGFPLMRGLLGDALPPSDVVSSSIWQSFPVWLTALAATIASVFIPLYRIYHQDVHFSLRN